jgi:lysophospholipase L1-like esterase
MMGDSITHGYDARITSQTYANIVMRRLDLDGINQGAAGYVFDADLIDPALFEGKKQPDIITVAYGTNDWNNKPREKYCRDIDEFFARLHEHFPNIPVLVITPIFRAAHYTTTKVGSFYFAREYLAEAAKKYENTYVLDGDKMVAHVYDYFRDVRVHPNDAGFATYGALVSDAVAEILGIRPKTFLI